MRFGSATVSWCYRRESIENRGVTRTCRPSTLHSVCMGVWTFAPPLRDRQIPRRKCAPTVSLFLPLSFPFPYPSFSFRLPIPRLPCCLYVISFHSTFLPLPLYCPLPYPSPISFLGRWWGGYTGMLPVLQRLGDAYGLLFNN